jgi:hypothetical protein
MDIKLTSGLSTDKLLFRQGKDGTERVLVNASGKMGLDVIGDVVGDVTGSAIKAVAVIPTATGATTGTIPAGTTQGTVASTNAAHIVILPAPVVGQKITLINNATGYEIRSSAPATTGINGGTGATVESAVAASVSVMLECISLTNWIGSVVSASGVVSVLQVAA